MNIVSVDRAPAERSFAVDRRELSSLERIVEFYEDAGTDYEHWSRNLNMHLGFYRWGLNPFDRESMLEQLNLEVAKRLEVGRDERALLVDLGCGMGAIARTVARVYPNSIINGVTIAPSHVRIASDLNSDLGLGKRINILNNDFRNLPFDHGSVHGAWAVESACYAGGADKADLIREAARVLRPGARFVIADCFIKNRDQNFRPLMSRCYSALCRNWALSEMPMLSDFVGALKAYGFQGVVVEDTSWRAAPSLAHAPVVVATFVMKKLLAGERIKKQSINNLHASLLATVLAMNRSNFSYCLISARRS